MKKIYVALLGTLLLAGCTTDNKKAERDPVTVESVVVEEATTKPTHTYVGRLEDAGSISMSFTLGGKITQLNVKNGQQVSAGQILAKVDDTQARSALATAEAKLRQAEDGFKRVNQVYSQGAVAEVKFIEVQSQLEQARSLVDGLRKQVDDCTLKAPISGTVNGLDAKIGQKVLPETTILTIITKNQMKAVFSVSENDIASFKPGGKAKVNVPAVGYVFDGTIKEINLIANPISHTYEVSASLSETEGKNLMQNMVAKVTLDAADVTGFVIPTSAVENRAGELSVWLVNDGKVERRTITTGTYAEGGVVVTGGLSAGDVVVTKGIQKLYSGAKVNEQRP